MDIRIKSSCGQSFGARQVSKAYIKSNNSKQCLELFSLDKSDLEFGNHFLKTFDLKKLYPNEKSYDGFKEWDFYIRNAISKIGDYNVVLASKNNRPCGIMAFYEKDRQFNLSYIATWRDLPNKDVAYVGKVLMHHLFSEANDSELLNISLTPTHATPRGKSCREFYSSLGFKRSANNCMNLFGANFLQKAKELEKLFEYEKLDDQTEIDSKITFVI